LILEAAHRDTVRKLYGAGWRPMMFVYGSLGLLVGALVWWFCRNQPEDHPAVNEAERSLIEGAPAALASFRQPRSGYTTQPRVAQRTLGDTHPSPANPEGVAQIDQPRDSSLVEPRWGSEILHVDVTQGGAASPPLSLGYDLQPLRGKEPCTTSNRAASVLGRLAASRSLGLLSASQFFTNVGWVFIMTWAPRYFQSVHQLPVEERALLVSIPPLVGWFGTVLGGVWTDYLLRTVGVRWSRALPIGLSRLLAVFAYLAFLFEPSPWVAVVLFSLVAFLTDWSQGTVWAFCQDIGDRHVASVLGWSNMWGNFGAAVTPPLLIWIVGPSQNWVAAFLACAAAFLLAGLTGLGIDATKPIAAAAGQGREA